MSSFAFSNKVALRYLWSRRAEAFITIITLTSILGVAIGVMVLTMVMAVMTGFQGELREKIIGATSHIVVRRYVGSIPEWEKVGEELKAIPGIKTVSPFTYNQVLVRHNDRTSGLLVRGIVKGTAASEQVDSYLSGATVDDLFSPPPVEIKDENGKPAEVTLPGIVIGKQLAATMGVFVGDPVSLLSPAVSSSPFGLMPRYRRFVVTGIYSSGLTEYESGLAYVTLKDAQDFFRMENKISGFEIGLHNADDAPVIALDITKRHPEFSASDWTSNQPIWEALKLEKRVYFIVLLLIIVMASFSIITTLVMMVLEKRRDIAIMKTMGATSGAVARIFVVQGAVIGALGTALGLVLGVAGSWALQKYGFPLDERVFQMSTLPVKVEPLNFALVGAAAFAICCLATIYPARRASALEPSDVLRYE